MELTDYINGSELLVEVFGYWPTFHDAEVLWMRFDRRPIEDDEFGVQLEAVLHTFEMTNEVSPNGHYVLRNHVLVQFRFRDVVELQMDGFNHQNALMGLHLTDLRHRQWERIFFQVQFSPAFGVRAIFQCHSIEVISVTPCSPTGIAIDSRSR